VGGIRIPLFETTNKSYKSFRQVRHVGFDLLFYESKNKAPTTPWMDRDWGI